MQLDHISNSALDRLVAAIASANTAPPVLVAAKILAGQSLTEAVPVPKGMRLWALALPSGWDESPISYSISFDGQIWYEPVDYVSSAPLVEPVRGVAGQAFLTSSYALLRATFVKVRSGSAAAPPIAQQADRTLQLLFLSRNSPTVF
jgi:hypothetical protein